MLLAFLLLVYVVAASLTILACFRRKYTVTDLSVCSSCSLRGFCSRLGLNKVLSPARIVKQPSRRFLALASILSLVGYVVAVLVYLVAQGFQVTWSSMAYLVALTSILITVLSAMSRSKPYHS